MKLMIPHLWNITVDTAQQTQLWLRHRISLEDKFNTENRASNIVLCDVICDHDKWPEMLYGAAVLLSWPDLNVISAGYSKCRPLIPYDEDIISFRHGPCMLLALKNVVDKSQIEPDIIICNGEGIAHPNRFGIACHIGLITITPSIGISTSSNHPVDGDDIIAKEEEYVISNAIMKEIGFTMQDIKYSSLVGKVLNGYYISPGNMVSVASAYSVVKHILKKSNDIIDYAHNEAITFMKSEGN